jgi:hypothetical protein
MRLIESLKKAFSKPYKTISVAQAKDLLASGATSMSERRRNGGPAGHRKPGTSPWAGCRPARRASRRRGPSSPSAPPEYGRPQQPASSPPRNTTPTQCGAA